MSQNIEGQNEFVNVSANGANSARLSGQNNSGNIASASASVSADQNSASMDANSASMGPSAMTNLPPSANLNSNSGPSAISPGLNSLAQNLNMDASAASNSSANTQNIESSAAPSMNMENSGSIVPEVPPVVAAPSTQPTLTFAPIVPPSAPLPASAPSPQTVPTLTAAEAAAAAAKAARSKKQSEADAGQAAMLAKLRNMYATEFANIPEKKRPKAKAYVARAAYYKEGAERNAYIKEWLRKDREAAEIRMGQRKKPAAATATPRSSLNSSLRSNSLAMSSAASNTRNITKKLKFYPSADPLRAQVIKARKHLDEIAERATKRLSETATDSKTRRVARELRTQMRKYTTILAKEVRHQASALERAAKARARAAYRTYRNTGSSASSGSATLNRTRKSESKTSSGNIINSYND